MTFQANAFWPCYTTKISTHYSIFLPCFRSFRYYIVTVFFSHHDSQLSATLMNTSRNWDKTNNKSTMYDSHLLGRTGASLSTFCKVPKRNLNHQYRRYISNSNRHATLSLSRGRGRLCSAAVASDRLCSAFAYCTLLRRDRAALGMGRQPTRPGSIGGNRNISEKWTGRSSPGLSIYRRRTNRIE